VTVNDSTKAMLDRHREHKAANSALRQQIRSIVVRLDVIGRTINDVDDEVMVLAEGVVADLEALRAQAVELAERRDYVYNVPGGGGYRTDDALDDLGAAVARARAAITDRESLIQRRERAAAQREAATELLAVRQHIASLNSRAAELKTDYETTAESSSAGRQVRIAAYDLMRELADARDQEVRLRVVTGELGSEQADNRRTANAAMRDQAATGLAALTER
jgi:hypothetical protein